MLRPRLARFDLDAWSGRASLEGSAIVLPSLRCLKLDTLSDVIITVDDVGVPKLAPDLFIEAARRLNSEPADCVVLEDSDQGITAASKAGMRSTAQTNSTGRFR